MNKNSESSTKPNNNNNSPKPKPPFKPAKDDTKPVLQDPVISPWFLCAYTFILSSFLINLSPSVSDTQIRPNWDGRSSAAITSILSPHFNFSTWKGLKVFTLLLFFWFNRYLFSILLPVSNNGFSGVACDNILQLLK